PFEIETKYIQLLEKSTEEILLIFPSPNAIQRQHHLGVFQVLKEKVNQYNNLKIRIIFPSPSQLPSSLSNESLKEKINLEFELLNSNKYKNNIFARYMDISLSTKSTILVIDRKESLVMEVKNDLKDKFSESVGFGTYSNSSPTVTSYVSIFESLWIQTELYQQLKDANEKLKMNDIMQKDFINIAVHELRNPIQPIIGLTEVLKNKTIDKKQQEMLDTIDRNAKRLMKLSDNVLDISKIENHTLSLKKENFNLNEMMQNTILEFTNPIDKINGQQQQRHKDTLKLRSMLKDDIFIYADKSRLNQVISNLLDNAIKFTKEKEEKDGNITITVEKDCSNYVIVSISDTGEGIDSKILPRLFTKFVTKSGSGGTGLGLYISKNIIEAHGGTIWAKNNKEGEGATFGFSLPNIN
ncbi:MAG TPA: HAMP domain-containing sensor histidine kinase, partial [Verrucomicrobiae bacterium]|nr:HAMP domain-containing sensor histidine kinase [Verrucomicrobiae bacterium]